MGFFKLSKKQRTGEDFEKLYASNRSFQSAGTKNTDGRYVLAEELYDFIVGFLSELLERNGFKYQKSRKIFKRSTQTGCDEISINFVDHVHYHANFTFNKRIDNLQKHITAIKFENGFNTINNYKEHNTVSATYRNITNDDFEIISYSVLKTKLAKLLTVIENEILPYFDKLNSVDFLNQTLNYPEKDNQNPFSFFSLNGFENSIINGLIIARILNDPNYDRLFSIHVAQHSQNLVLKEKLTKLKEYLEKKKIEV